MKLTLLLLFIHSLVITANPFKSLFYGFQRKILTRDLSTTLQNDAVTNNAWTGLILRRPSHVLGYTAIFGGLTIPTQQKATSGPKGYISYLAWIGMDGENPAVSRGFKCGFSQGIHRNGDGEDQNIITAPLGFFGNELIHPNNLTLKVGDHVMIYAFVTSPQTVTCVWRTATQQYQKTVEVARGSSSEWKGDSAQWIVELQASEGFVVPPLGRLKFDSCQAALDHDDMEQDLKNAKLINQPLEGKQLLAGVKWPTNSTSFEVKTI
jgi:hypothetical protein